MAAVTTPRQAAMALLTVVVHDWGSGAARLDILNRTIRQDLDDCDTDEARGDFLVGTVVQLATVAAGLAQAVADFHNRPVEDLLATLAGVGDGDGRIQPFGQL